MDVWVSGLSEGVTEGDFRKLFGVFGQIRSASVIMDLATKKPKGAVVDMVDEGSAETAIGALNGKNVKGTAIQVSRNPRGSASGSRG